MSVGQHYSKQQTKCGIWNTVAMHFMLVRIDSMMYQDTESKSTHLVNLSLAKTLWKNKFYQHLFLGMKHFETVLMFNQECHSVSDPCVPVSWSMWHPAYDPGIYSLSVCGSWRQQNWRGQSRAWYSVSLLPSVLEYWSLVFHEDRLTDSLFSFECDMFLQIPWWQSF